MKSAMLKSAMLKSAMLKSTMQKSAKTCIRALATTALFALGSISQLSCYARSDDPIDSTQTFRVRITKVNGIAPPTPEEPLPPNIGTTDELWEVEIEAVGPDLTAAGAETIDATDMIVMPGFLSSSIRAPIGSSKIASVCCQ